MTFEQLLSATRGAALQTGLEVTVSPLDFYAPEDEETKNITLRLSFVSHDRTLRGEEVTQYMDDISKAVTAETKGMVI